MHANKKLIIKKKPYYFFNLKKKASRKEVKEQVTEKVSLLTNVAQLARGRKRKQLFKWVFPEARNLTSDRQPLEHRKRQACSSQLIHGFLDTYVQ